MPDRSSLLKIVILLSLILAFPSASVYSQKQNLAFETLSVEQGMPTAVMCILQDRTGYLWFGTYGGLYRYDGYGFVSYKHNFDDSTSIADNRISTLYEDKSGVLWIGSSSGLEKFDRTRGTFMLHVPNPSSAVEGATNYVGAICEDKRGILWVGTEWGLCQFDRTTGTFSSLRHDSTDPGSIAHNSVNVIYEDKEGSLWFATGGGLDRFDFETGKFVHCWYDPDKRHAQGDTTGSQYWINSLCEDDSGTLWLGTNEGLVEFNPKEGTFSHYRHSPKGLHNRIVSICQDVMTGSLWVATGRVLLSFDRQSKAFAQYEYRTNAVCSERSGTFWAGTDTYIRKLNRAKQPFKRYPMNDIVYVVKSGREGILWFFTSKRYKKFDIRKEEFIPYTFGKDSVMFVYNSGGDVLLYSEEGILSTIDSLGVRHVWGPYSRDVVRSVSVTWKSSKGFWIGTRSGNLWFFDPKSRSLTEVKNVKLRIRYIYEDDTGLVWIATYMGKLFCYDQVRRTIVEFISKPDDPETISGKQIHEIYEDTQGRLWFATNNGLNRFDRSTNSFIRFYEKDGLPSTDILGILEDAHGCLWISSNKGISKVNPVTRQVKHYDVSYGLEPTADISFGKGCKTRNGEMYFGGAGGFTRFHPDSVKDNPFVPPIVITSFRKFDKPAPLSSDVRLPYDENFIAFEFAALSYISPERNQYAYMMEGLDKNWVYSGTRRFASYPGLEPGKYTFRVKGSNNDGVWNEAGTSIAVVISPPWWETPWAYILASLLVLSLLYAAWKMQVKNIRMEHAYDMSRFEAKKLHEVDELKSRFFANISHEFRTPLTLILGPVEVAIEAVQDDKIRGDLRLVQKHAHKLLGLVNQLLDISKLESGTMKLRTVSLNIVQLLKVLALSFSSYAERRRIALTFNAEAEDIPVYVDKEKLDKIVTNILSNAFKFTPEGGRIGVAVTRDEHYVNVAVRDTGIGVPADKIPSIFNRFYQVDGSHTRVREGAGIGLSLTKELIELHKGTIEVDSTEGKGTTFTIHLPLGREHLQPEEICEPEEGEERRGLVGIQASDSGEAVIDNEETKAGKHELGVPDETGKSLVLIVEDNTDVRYYIRGNVKEEYAVLEAVDGEDGWNKSVEHIPDVIVSDVMMPKMDGFALCDKLKRDERTSHIPVILLTAKASSQDKIEGFQTGADDYIMKPFEPAELKARIGNLIEQRKRVHEHFRKHGLFEIQKEKITSLDSKFLHNTVAVIARHMSDSSFGVETLAAEMAVSRSVLLKKIEALVGEPPSELIKRTRLNRAAELIEGKFGNISEIALEVGFSNPSYFAECFKKQFGTIPSHFHLSTPHQ